MKLNRWQRIVAWIIAGLAALIVLIVVAAIIIVHTQWFRDYVRTKIITYAENATGGTVTLKSFNFDWSSLTATVDGFVLHGTEPASAAPLFQADEIKLRLSILASFHNWVELDYLGVQRPQANVIVYPDGHTNFPSPKVKPTGNTTVLEDLINIAIRKFDIRDGTINLADHQYDFSAQGENLRAELNYNIASSTYDGQVSMDPLFVRTDGNPRLPLKVVLPVHLERDKVQVTNARITAPESQVIVTAALTNLRDPHISGHVNADIALNEIKEAAGKLLPIVVQPGAPDQLRADVTFSMGDGRIEIGGAQASLGNSNVVASGTLKSPTGQGAVQFKTTLDLTQLAKLYPNQFKPTGTVVFNGQAKMTGTSNIAVNGNIEAKNVSFQENGKRYNDINLYSAVSAEKNGNNSNLDLKGLKLNAFGGTFAGNVNLHNMEQFKVNGNLSNFNLQRLAQVMGNQQLAYNGVVSGPIEASGDLKHPSTVQARVNLAITPGKGGVPISGRINASYNGATGAVELARSYINLPSSHIELNGSLNNRVQVSLVTHNMNDLLAALGPNGPEKVPIRLLPGGTASFNGTISGKLTTPHIQGRLALTRFELEQRPFDSFAANIAASPSGAAITEARLTRGALLASFDASVGLHDWKALPSEPLKADAIIRNASLADLLAVAGQSGNNYSGVVNASAHIAGTIGDPRGQAVFTAADGAIYDEHYDQIAATVNFTDRLISIPDARLISGQNRIDLTANYAHAANSLTTGNLQVHVASNQMQLAQFRVPGAPARNIAGVLQIMADATANMADVNGKTEFRLTSVNGNVAARGITVDGTNYGNLTATATTAGQNVDYKLASNFAGSTIQATGQTRLAPQYPTTANLSIASLPVQRVLAVAGRSDIPFSGNLNATAQLSGTLQDPHAAATVRITNANYYEHFDTIQARFDYSKALLNIPSLEIVSGSARADLSASFVPRPPGQFATGDLSFRINTNQIQLAQFKTLEKHFPSLTGAAEVNAAGTAVLENAKNQPPVLITSLNASASATGLSINKKPAGDVHFTAQTRGKDLTFALDSDFAQASIHGKGAVALSGDYPMNAQLAFNNLTLSGLRPWIGAQMGLGEQRVDAVVDGSATVSGPLLNVSALTGGVRIPRLEILAAQRGVLVPNATRLELKNQGPIVATLSRSVVRIDSAHITGPGTDISVAGTATFQPTQALDISVAAKTDLSLLKDFSPDIYSNGTINLQLAVNGPLTNPVMNGQLRLQNVAFNNINWPNGISNANGLIVFSGKDITIRSLTGESGGGQIAITGGVGFANGLAFNLGATANGVRVRYPQGVSTDVNAKITLTGASDNSTLAGSVSLEKVEFNPMSDFGSILSASATPVQVPAAPSPLEANMHLKLTIQTAPNIAFQTAIAQNVEATANLRVTGTVATPGVLGRVNIQSGELIFFGTKYTVQQGNISFFNPLRIEPILDVNLQTNVQGVQIVLTVTGPVDNMKLTHTSDPPLPFNEVISLLATGQAPSSDPILAAHQPLAAPQTMQQIGESALLGQVVANPVASRLQRVFGVSSLKISPAFVGNGELPQARVTLMQQITHNLSFTYITDLTNPNEQVIRIEWAIDPTWSAVATRDENGMFGIDFFYKKRLR